ncbi:hypothetical protein Hypma_008601, partial [Hypsizygus marmoreus]
MIGLRCRWTMFFNTLFVSGDLNRLC